MVVELQLNLLTEEKAQNQKVENNQVETVSKKYKILGNSFPEVKNAIANKLTC